MSTRTQIRILFTVAAVALLAGWLGLRRGSAALEAKLAAASPAASETSR